MTKKKKLSIALRTVLLRGLESTETEPQKLEVKGSQQPSEKVVSKTQRSQ
jgi:hypothetical protein